MVGDWNLLLDPCVGGKNYHHRNSTRPRGSVWQLMVELDLTDICRNENHDLNNLTWRRSNKNKELQMGRLDFFLTSK